METNEVLKRRLVHEAEAEIVKLLKGVEELKRGDLKGVEQEVLTRMFASGRSVLERVVQDQATTREIPTHRQGSYGPIGVILTVRYDVPYNECYMVRATETDEAC